MSPDELRALAEALDKITPVMGLEELHHMETLDRAADYLRACAEQWPDGWQLVPVEPTGLMVDAGREAMQRAPDLGGIVLANTAEVMDSYTAMLAAAPATPQAEPKREPLSDTMVIACARVAIARIQPDEWVATDADLIDFARTIESEHGIGGSDAGAD